MIALAERTAGYSTTATGNHIFRFGKLVIQTAEHRHHTMHNSTGHHHKISLTGRGSRDFPAKARHIEARRSKRHKFNAATTGGKSERPERVTAPPVDKIVKNPNKDIGTIGTQFLYESLNIFVILKCLVRHALCGYLIFHFHSSAPLRQA